MSDRTKVLIVDDHLIFRQGLCSIIEADDRLDVVSDAESAEKALELLDEKGLEVQVVVLDIDMPGMNGLQLAQRLLQRDPPIQVVLLTMHKNEHLFNEAVDIGVKAYLLKDEAVSGVVEGIHQVATGNSYISPALADVVMKRARRSSGFQKDATGLGALTPMERRVLKLVANNKSSKEIAAELFISPRTVGAHRNNISGKLELKGKLPLVNFALENRDAISNLPD